MSLEPIPISQSEESVEETEEDGQIFDRFRFDQVHARRRDPVATRQEQSIKPSPGNEVTILENPSPNLDHDLPIALRKGTQACTKRSLYPLSHCVFSKFSLNHKSFLSTLSAILIPNSLSEALTKREWRLVMVAEMDALQKIKT